MSTTHDPDHRTAHVIGLERDEEDGTLLLRARCSECRKTVLHGAGTDLDAVQLGWRVGHCGCGDYELTDPHRVVPQRLRVLRREDASFREHLQVAAHRRRVEDAEEAHRRALAEARTLPPREARRLRREAAEVLDAVRAALPEAAE
ncbi:hypothetical protein SAMN05660350_01084 [Geodermatophilus obscurus]|uniref:Uncharacterized protein n=1 Tax=Geodermatophilus obscurus TaxID=1861 RepID=A0A1M7SW08_9ACTN|nr:hypothetical protein [Geodermatophilus obscurus]SHN62703.1 hypothetical protein SAMN05660350_01084 [Geodermatophilus obscurus]